MTMAAQASLSQAEQVLNLMSLNVRRADADLRVKVLRESALAIRPFIERGDLNPSIVEDEFYSVVNDFGLAGDPGSEAELEIVDIARAAVGEFDQAAAEVVIDETEEFQPTPISRLAEHALASWDRTLAKLEKPEFKVPKYMEATTEVLRLAKFEGGDPRQRQQLIDDLYEMGKRHGISATDVETHMAAITRGMGPRHGARDTVASTGERPSVASLADYGLSPDAEQDLEAQPRAQAPAPLQLICPPDWRDVALPPMRWLATHRIPAADATILSGDGGGGKTTVALQLAVAVEQGLGDWLGTVVESGPVIFFSAEEPQDEMRRRLDRVSRKRGLDAADIKDLHFHFADPDKCLLAVARPTGTMVPTGLFNSLAAAARDIRPMLLIVDSIAATFGGNQNDRVHARTFVAMFRRLAQETDCAVLLLDHPSLSGITSGSGRGGSMDWQNATRARLHLETVEGEDGTTGRVLEVKKTNYGPSGEKVNLRWEEGCFVLEGTASAPHRAAGNATADQRYLECLDAVTAQGRHVCHAPGRGYAPKTFAEMPQANGLTWRAFQQAQERLFAACTIENVAYGPKSKNTKCIARKV